MSILCVEDDPVSLKLIQKILNGAGYETIPATSVTEAIECLESNSSIEIIISDIMMPERDGFDLLEYLKTNIKFRDIPVIMATASGNKESVLKSIKLGAKDFIIKPFNTKLLVKKVRDIMKTEPSTVLIVDDEEFILDILSQVIHREGYKFIKANSGSEALEIINSNRVDIVLSDINMPKMSGFELLAEIKDKHPKMKVVLITGCQSKHNRQTVMEKGADGFLTKPFKNTEIVETMNDIL